MNPFIRKNLLSFITDDRWTIWFFENEGPGMYTMNAAGWATYAHTALDDQTALTEQPRSIHLVVLDQYGTLYDPTSSTNFWKIVPIDTPYPSDSQIMTAWKTWAGGHNE